MASTSQASTTQLEEEPNLDNEFESHDDVLDDGDAAIQSTYERRKEKLADHWGELRASLIRIKISTHGYPPIGANCICCVRWPWRSHRVTTSNLQCSRANCQWLRAGSQRLRANI